MDRLRSDFWVSAQLSQTQAMGLFSFVVKKGDPERGGIIIKHAPLNGTAQLFERSVDFDDNVVWRQLGPEGGEAEAKADERLKRRLSFDPDVWIVEIEDPQNIYQLDAPLLV